MARSPTVDDIRSSRDMALDALEDSLISVGNEIAETTIVGPFLTRLTTRNTALMNEAAAIRAAATDAVLALPEIITAAAALNRLSAKMETAAQALPNATNLLSGTATVLSLGQQFADLLASVQKT